MFNCTVDKSRQIGIGAYQTDLDFFVRPQIRTAIEILSALHDDDMEAPKEIIENTILMLHTAFYKIWPALDGAVKKHNDEFDGMADEPYIDWVEEKKKLNKAT